MFGAIGQYSIGQASEAEEDSQTGALLNMLSAADLSFMRDSTELLMPDSCNILSLTSTSDGAGGQSESWGTVTTVSCRLDVKDMRDIVSGGAVQSYIKTMLSVPYDTSITEVNRVEHGGITYAVVAPTNSDQSWIAVKRVELERV